MSDGVKELEAAGRYEKLVEVFDRSRLRLLFDVASEAFYLTNLSGDFLDCSKSLEDLLGYERDQLIGQGFLKLGILGPRDIPRAAFLLAKNAAGYPTGPDVFVLSRQSGDPVAAEVRMFPIKSGGGVVVLGVARDVTARELGKRVVNPREAALDKVKVGVTITDPAGKIMYVNETEAKMHGYRSPEELLGKDVGVLCRPGDRKPLPLTRLKALKSRRRESFNVRKDRTVFPVLLDSEFVRDGFGRIVGTVTTSQDLTELRQRENALIHRGDTLERLVRERTAQLTEANTVLRQEINERMAVERKLRESERRHRALTECSQGLICTHDLEGIFTSVNPAAARMLGRQPHTILGTHVAEILTPETRELFQDYLERVKEHGIAEGLMAVLTTAGERRIWKYKNVLHSDVEGEPYILGHAIDVTEYHNIERSLRQIEGDYNGLVMGARYGICRTDRELRFLSANPALVEMLGYESDRDLIESEESTFEDPEQRVEVIKGYTASGRIDVGDVRWRREDGSVIRVSLSGGPIRGGNHEVVGFELIVDDETERRALEAQLRHAQKMEAVGQLTGGIAHDFNNILTAVLGNAELLRYSLPDGDSRSRTEIEGILQAAERGAALVRKLMVFSRREQLELKSIQLRDVITGLKEMLVRLLPESIETVVTAEEEDLRIMGDKAALEQMIINLATNARDAMPDGGCLHIDTYEVMLDEEYFAGKGWGEGEPGPYACLAIRDTGRGMDQRTKARVFEPFFTTKPSGRGTGLGMAMVYGLIKQHGGYIEVDSVPDQGTTIRLYLPVTRTEESITDRVDSRAEAHGGDEIVLVVEDEPTIRQAIQRLLERYGYTVLVAADGGEALELLAAPDVTVDLVIADVVMPRVGGSRLQQELEKQSGSPRIIFTSGHTVRSVRESGGISADIPFLRKPWTAVQLLRLVREVLDS